MATNIAFLQLWKTIYNLYYNKYFSMCGIFCIFAVSFLV